MAFDILHKKRFRAQSGQFFRCSLEGREVIGRVIDSMAGPNKSAVLIQFFKTPPSTKEMETSCAGRPQLIPPILAVPQLWSRGVCEPILTRPILPEEQVEVAFRNIMVDESDPVQFVDGHRRPVPKPKWKPQPYSVAFILGVELRLRRALGLQDPPEDGKPSKK